MGLRLWEKYISFATLDFINWRQDRRLRGRNREGSWSFSFACSSNSFPLQWLFTTVVVVGSSIQLCPWWSQDQPHFTHSVNRQRSVCALSQNSESQLWSGFRYFRKDPWQSGWEAGGSTQTGSLRPSLRWHSGKQTWVRSLGQEDPLEKEMATHSSILTRNIPCTEGLVGCSRTWLSNTEQTHTHTRKKIRTHTQETEVTQEVDRETPGSN